MLEEPPPADRSGADLHAEIARLNKIVQALMDRAERSTDVQGSDFSLFQSTVMLEEQVQARTAALEAALRENERITRALRNSEAMYRSVITAMVEGIVFQASDGRITGLNPAAARILGCTRDEIVGQSTDSPPWPTIREDGSPFPGEQHPATVTLRTGEPQFGVVMGICKPEGIVTWISMNSQLLAGATSSVEEHRGAAVVTTFHDITERKWSEAHDRLRGEILGKLARGLELPALLDALVRAVEAEQPGLIASILLVDHEGRLRRGAAPSLPESYLAAMEGKAIGDGVGSCGTAAYRGELVVVEDIQQHPYWVRCRGLAASAGLAACWSQPVFDARGKVVATIAMYAHSPQMPTAHNLAYLAHAANIASIAINRHNEEKQLRMAMQALETTRECVYWIDVYGRMLYVNPATEQELGYSAEELRQMTIPDIDPNTPPEMWGPEGELTQVLEGQGLRKFVTQHRHRDGHLIPVEVDSDPFVYDGSTCFIAITRDISGRLVAEDALRRSEAKFAALFSLTPEPMTLARLRDGMLMDVSHSAAEYWGCPREDLVGRTALPEDIGFWIDAEQRGHWVEALRRDGEVSSFETQIRRRDGTPATVLMYSKIVEIDGEPCVISNIHDVSERRAAEEALRKSEAKFSALFSLTPDPLALTRLADGVVLEVSRSFGEYFGYPRNEVIGRTTVADGFGIWVEPEHRRQWKERLEQDREVLGFETSLRRKDGSIMTVLVSGKVVEMDGEQCVISVAHDISEQKQRAEHLDQIAHHDPLTGLPNRLLLGDRLRQAIAQSQRSGTRVAVCYLDLDGFKDVNDQLGHQAGDQVLIEVANRLVACVRGGDTVARLGGDEFVVLLSGLADDEECRQALGRLLRAIAAPYAHGNDEQSFLAASIGVTLFPSDPADPDTLVRHADHAMYVAKQAGKNRYQMFDTRLEQRIEARYSAQREVADALRAGQLRLHYQPKVDCRHGRVVGAEALIRWQHPTLGLLPPAEFLPLVEDTDLALDVGEWVIRAALAQIVAWRRQGIGLPVSVNAFIRQLLQPGFADRLAAILARYPEAEPGALQIEIVETAALQELDSIRQVIEDCRPLGVAFSLDDFGTGYSTLAHLRHLPATEIKIDLTFVGQMLTNAEDLAIVEAVIGLACAFDRTVVAEGVETPAHIVRLLALGCDRMQGYALARPMAAAELTDWLGAFRPDPAWLRPTGSVDVA